MKQQLLNQKKMSENNPNNIEFLTRSSDEIVSVTKLERVGKLIRKVEYLRPWGTLLEKNLESDSTKDLYIKLEAEWLSENQKTEQ